MFASKINKILFWKFEDGQYFKWFIWNHFFTIKLHFHKKNSGNLVLHLINIHMIIIKFSIYTKKNSQSDTFFPKLKKNCSKNWYKKFLRVKGFFISVRPSWDGWFSFPELYCLVDSTLQTALTYIIKSIYYYIIFIEKKFTLFWM